MTDLATFRFLAPGPLVDGELELVAPQPTWVTAALAACQHPMTVRDAPVEAATTREAMERFLRSAPHGREPGDMRQGRVPAYHFWMRLGQPFDRQVKIAGGISLRIGTTPEIELYAGHIGYHVYPPARGQHYAERACRLLLPLARGHGMDRLWITCNPDNAASRRTIERLGAALIEIIKIPSGHSFYLRGEREKCRYLLEL